MTGTRVEEDAWKPLLPTPPGYELMPSYSLQAGGNLYYELYETELPTPNATPIVFLNGMTQTTMSWKTLARRLAPRSTVLTYDALGQGQSVPKKDASFSLEMHADDLAELLDHLEVERAHLVGFSHGARVALAMAKHHPERLDHLVLCSATAKPTTLQRAIIRSWREILQEGGIKAMSWAALPMILGNDYLTQHEHLIKGIISASTGRNQEEGVARLLEGIMRYPDLSELAEHVNAPTLVISGEQDMLVSKSGAQELARLCGGEHREISNVGHTVPIEQPQLFESLLLEFLPSLTR